MCSAPRRSAWRETARSGSRRATTRSRPTAWSAAFEPLRCNVFITESTFGLPIYRWRPQSEIIAGIERWWRENAAAGRASVLYAYALGKAQRVLACVDPSIGPIVCHGAVEPINAIYREAGVALPPTRLAQGIADKRVFSQSADRRAAFRRRRARG